MAYSDLESYIMPRGLESYNNDSMAGTSIHYRGPTATLTTHKPSVGADWNGFPVLTARIVEIHGAADYSDLFVVTGKNVTYSGTLGTPSEEQTYYGLRWRPVQKPLEVHPAFQSGGTYELDAAGRKCILGWRAEQDPALRSAYKFRQLDSYGQPGDEVDIATVSANALVFIKLIEKGVEEYVDYLPIWRRRTIYKGSNPPTADEIGEFDATPPSVPSGVSSAYHFVKSADDIERIGTSSRWRRDEEWEGGKQVFCDRDAIFPTGDPTA